MEPLEKGNPCNGNSMTKALDAMSNTRTHAHTHATCRYFSLDKKREKGHCAGFLAFSKLSLDANFDWIAHILESKEHFGNILLVQQVFCPRAKKEARTWGETKGEKLLFPANGVCD